MKNKTNEQLLDLLRNGVTHAEKELARVELTKRRTANRMVSSDNRDGLDFLIGYSTGMPIPTYAGMVGAVLHSEAVQAPARTSPVFESSPPEQTYAPSSFSDAGSSDSGGGGSSE